MVTPPLRGTLPGPTGELELLVEYPPTTPRVVVLIAHPHPLYGGSLQNKVVYTAARAARNSHLIAVRFNFRGVGRSGGAYDAGVGEQEDLLALIHWIEEEYPQLPLTLVGFSFGARIALLVGSELSLHQLILIAPPLRLFSDLQDLLEVSPPWAVVMGDADEVISFAEVSEWIGRQHHPPRFEIFPGAGHFFHGRLVEFVDTGVNPHLFAASRRGGVIEDAAASPMV